MIDMREFSFSMQMRDTIKRLAIAAVEDLRPSYRYGTVESIDLTNLRCNVLLNGDPTSVVVPMGAVIQPTEVGQIVRVDGKRGDRFISDVITPPVVPVLESWKKIGTTGNPSFNTNWGNFSASESGGGWTHGAFYKDLDGWVHLKGLVNRASGSGDIIFALPSGYRPAIEEEFATLTNDALGVLRISSNGNVQLSIPGGTSDTRWVNLSGIQFYGGTGTWADKLNHFDSQPLYVLSQTPFSVGNGQIAYLSVRDDGFVRGSSYSALVGTIPFLLALVPPSMQSRFTALLGAYNWTGATAAYARTDIVQGHQILIQTGTGGSAGTALSFADLHWWHFRRDPDFANLSSENGGAYYGSHYAPPGYYKDKYGHVHLRGLFTGGTMTINTTVTTLPVGNRPPAREMFLGAGHSSLYRWDIRNDGTVKLGIGGLLSTFYSLDSIQFRAGDAIP